MQQAPGIATLVQATLKELGKQMVISEPLAMIIQGDQEQLIPLQAIQQVLAVTLPRQGIAQVGVELIEYRGLLEKALQVFRQTVENILGEIIGDIAFGAAEFGKKRRPVAVPLQGQHRQVQRGDPALGAPVEQLHFGLGQLQLAHIQQVGPGFGQAQAQILSPEPERPRLVIEETRLEPGAGNQVDILRQALDQITGTADQARMTNAMKVIQSHVELAFDFLQISLQSIDQCLEWQRDLAVQQVADLFAKAGHHTFDGTDNIKQQALRLAVGLIAGQPGQPGTGLLQTLPELIKHRAFAKACGGTEDQQALVTLLEQTLDQCTTYQHRAPTQLRRVKLGWQQGRTFFRGAFRSHYSSNPNSRARRIACVRLRTLSFS